MLFTHTFILGTASTREHRLAHNGPGFNGPEFTPQNFRYLQMQNDALRKEKYMYQQNSLRNNADAFNNVAARVNHVGFNGSFPVAPGPFAMSFPPSAALQYQRNQQYNKQYNSQFAGRALAMAGPIPAYVQAQMLQEEQIEAGNVAAGYEPYGASTPTSVPQHMQGLGAPPTPGRPNMNGPNLVVAPRKRVFAQAREGDPVWNPFVLPVQGMPGVAGGQGVAARRPTEQYGAFVRDEQGRVVLKRYFSDNSVHTEIVDRPGNRFFTVRDIAAAIQSVRPSSTTVEAFLTRDFNALRTALLNNNGQGANKALEDFNATLTREIGGNAELLSRLTALFHRRSLQIAGTGMVLEWDAAGRKFDMRSAAPSGSGMQQPGGNGSGREKADRDAKGKTEGDEQAKTSASIGNFEKQLREITERLAKIGEEEPETEKSTKAAEARVEELQKEIDATAQTVKKSERRLAEIREANGELERKLNRQAEDLTRDIAKRTEEAKKIVEEGGEKSDLDKLHVEIKRLTANQKERGAEAKLALAKAEASFRELEGEVKLFRAQVASLQALLRQAQFIRTTAEETLKTTQKEVKALQALQRQLQDKIEAARKSLS